MGQALHTARDITLTWLPVLFFGLICYLLWRTVQMMPRVKGSLVSSRGAMSSATNWS